MDNTEIAIEQIETNDTVNLEDVNKKLESEIVAKNLYNLTHGRNTQSTKRFADKGGNVWSEQQKCQCGRVSPLRSMLDENNNKYYICNKCYKKESKILSQNSDEYTNMIERAKVYNV